jgi:hypothetical protein
MEGESMNGHYRPGRWAAALLVALVALGVGWMAYGLGYSQGLAQGAAAAAPHALYPYGWYRPWGFGFGFLFPFLFFFFVLRLLFWGGPWRRGWYGAGWRGMPPAFEEWHARAHEQMKAQPAPRSDL